MSYIIKYYLIITLLICSCTEREAEGAIEVKSCSENLEQNYAESSLDSIFFEYEHFLNFRSNIHNEHPQQQVFRLIQAYEKISRIFESKTIYNGSKIIKIQDPDKIKLEISQYFMENPDIINPESILKSMDITSFKIWIKSKLCLELFKVVAIR